MAEKKKINISMGADALLENGFFYLEKKKWKQSKEYFEKVIEINPRNPQAYVGLLLVSHKLPTIDSLPNSSKPFYNNNNYKSALKYGSEELISQLHTYAELYNKNIEEKYQATCKKLSESQTLESFNECYDAFLELGKYKNAESMAEKAKESIDILNYEDCVAKINDNLCEEEYSKLYSVLSRINYKDSQQLADKCRARLELLRTERQENERKEQTYSLACNMYNTASSIKYILAAKETFESISDYKDSKVWISKCQNKLESKKTSFLFYKLWNNKIFTTVFSALVLVLTIVLICVLADEIDVGILIILGMFIAIPFVILLVSSISKIKKDSDDKKLNNYFTNQGKDEIQKLESFMKINNIPVPRKSTDKLKYMTEMLKVTLEHYQSIFVSNLIKQGYSNSFNISRFGTFYYNSKSVLIYHDVFFHAFEPSTKNGFTYVHYDEQWNAKYWSLSEVIDYCKRIESPSSCQELAQNVSLDELFWYVEYPSSAGYKLADTASGAILGGLLLGPIGVLAGGMSSSNSQEKEEKEEIKVFLGKKSVVRWEVAKGDVSAKSAIQTLNTHLPNNRLSDSYKKHM